MTGFEDRGIAREAGAWLFRLKEERSPECEREFTAWLQASPKHVTEFLLATATDVELGGLESASGVNIEALLAESAGNVVALDTDKESPRPVSASRRRRRGMLVAAASVAAIAVTFGVLWQQGISGSREYRTDIGEQRALKLPDGSVVQLNTRSRIEVRFSDRRRTVELLEGEALFTAAQDGARPFEVLSGATTVLALGTQFNVYRRTNDALVSVIEGRVQVSQLQAQPVLLQAGEQAAAESSGRIVRTQEPQVARAVAWRQRHLEFRSATVAEVAAEFNRYNKLQIRVDDTAIAARRMSGVFAADEPRSLLDFLRNEGGVMFREDGDEVTLSVRTDTP